MFKKDLTPAPKQKLKSSVQRSLRQALLTTYPLLSAYMDEILPRKASLSSMKLPDRHTLYVVDADDATTSPTSPPTPTPTPLFFQRGTGTGTPGGGEIIPHLRLVHRFPDAFPSVRIDSGAIRFVLSGATLMAPGLTSAGGRLPLDTAAAAAAATTATTTTSGGDGSGEGNGEGEQTQTQTQTQSQYLDADGRWSRELVKGEPVVIMAEGKREACAVGVLVVGTAEVKRKGKGPVMEEAHYLGDGLWNLSLD